MRWLDFMVLLNTLAAQAMVDGTAIGWSKYVYSCRWEEKWECENGHKSSPQPHIDIVGKKSGKIACMQKRKKKKRKLRLIAGGVKRARKVVFFFNVKQANAKENEE